MHALMHNLAESAPLVKCINALCCIDMLMTRKLKSFAEDLMPKWILGLLSKLNLQLIKLSKP